MKTTKKKQQQEARERQLWLKRHEAAREDLGALQSSINGYLDWEPDESTELEELIEGTQVIRGLVAYGILTGQVFFDLLPHHQADESEKWYQRHFKPALREHLPQGMQLEMETGKDT